MFKFAYFSLLSGGPSRVGVCILLFVMCGAAGIVDWESEGRAMMNAGKYSVAVHAFEQAIAGAQASDMSSPHLMGLFVSLAAAYAQAGQLASSAREYRQALSMVEKTEGRDSLNYALLLANLASLPIQKWNREETIAIVQQAIAVYGGTRSAECVAALRGFLGHLFLEQKRYQEAEPLLVAALAELAELKTANLDLMSNALEDVGVLRFYQGRYAESVDVDSEALRVMEAALGADHVSLVPVLNNLATSYLKMGSLDEAGLTYQRALAICGKTLGFDHPTYGTLLQNYAAVLQKLGHKHDANRMKKRSEQIGRASDRRNGVGMTVDASSLR